MLTPSLLGAARSVFVVAIHGATVYSIARVPE